MSVYVINPLEDPRWDELVSRHPRSSPFHLRGWLEALSRTYGYRPLALTSAPPGKPLQDGFVFCRVASWLTGTRLVSLPFADHCEPLLDEFHESQEFMPWLRSECERVHWDYVEMRPLSRISFSAGALQPSQFYCFHELDLTRSLEQIYGRLHRDSIQRRIRRAEKERFTYVVGNDQRLADEFYQLVLVTRRRQKLPPQPRSWFKNLVASMGDRLQIRMLRNHDVPMAALLTLRHRSTVVYKYGCSDARYHHFGVMPWLYWRLIEESKTTGAEHIDFGRSDLDRSGLITFKDKLGTTKRLLTYYRYSAEAEQRASSPWGWQFLRRACAVLPDVVLSTGGRLLYRHIG